MRRDTRLLWFIVASLAGAAALVALWLGATVALVAAALEAAQRPAVAAMVAPHVPALLLTTLMLVGIVALIAQTFYQRWIAPAARLLEQARVLTGAEVDRELKLAGAGAELRGLAQTISELARQRGELRRGIDRQVADASQEVAQERNRLAALMSELTQSVVVCNLDGRILLYNNRARVQFRALSSTPTLADGAELIGLGRSIYTVFDRRLVAHALENVQQRLDRGAADPSAQFVTVTRAGQLLRVQVAPVQGVAADEQADSGSPPLAGFVLMLDNVTREYEQESERDRLLHGLTEGSRGSLANLQAAVEILDDPTLDEGSRERFLAIVREETRAMSQRIQTVASQAGGRLATRWPLEEMLGADLVAAAQRQIEAQLASPVRGDDVDASLWLNLDSFSLLQGLSYLAERLHDEHDVKDLRLRLSRADARHAHLDLLWVGRAMSTETVMSWELDPMRIGNQSVPLTLREVVQRHGGEFWFERDRVRHQAFFRFLLPLAGERDELEAATFVRADSRPEYYDFDLFRVTESTRALDDRRLVELTYTVFDTETTGLEPSAGDEIIQIGAVRLVNGKLRRAESFEQLVDPGREIPAATIPIHGIEPSMVAGKPKIDTVLPAFHAYVHDTVLVAHNAAFDMRFLQTKEDALGLRFDQPVLDTLLLSALVHPNQESHTLEAIAERFDVPVIGRHTALGDAIVTAEVFVKLIPLLADRGIQTLGQAREASQRTYFARLKY
ncbi:MAG: DNA polymerase III subunit epsilon [Burkholderiales bacterium]|nr:MAG: DNA polymerase III subunit epsilon [Burkholderiales bacterium]